MSGVSDAVWIGKPLSGRIHDCINQVKFLMNFYWSNSQSGEPKHDAWFVFIYSQMNAEERTLSQASHANANGVNVVFQDAVNRIFENISDVRAEFERWFSSNWLETAAAPEPLSDSLTHCDSLVAYP
jgi:hypothetical protein